ncbi:bifunctional metallophosphatase/5'-nucleotidase [Falsibacillus pallidus]|uniref:bifunctional metallophosphatase/5'-nucleotidase n=1 Tax=Falsibacillus pallidus TaxID=493781 RepID=UPI003D954DC3
MRFKIIHTNDLHSHFEAFAKAVTVIKKEKNEHTLLLDGGDFADFKSIELQGTRGIAAIELLTEAGYDALTVGNNEMFNGVDTLEHMASDGRIPFISANLSRKDRTSIKGLLSSTIIEKDGIRFFITGTSPDMGVFCDGLGIHMTDFKRAIQEELEKNKGLYDVGIILNHVGTFADFELIGKLDGIDVILSAHDHQLFPEVKVHEGIIWNSAGNYGEHVGVIEIEVTEAGVSLIDSKMIETKDFEGDESILSILQKNKEMAVEILSKPLYSLDEPLWHDVIEENPISNLIADGLRDMLGADLGLINSGIVNAGAFGFISRKKLIETCPSPLNPTYFEIQGKDLLKALEDSLDSQVCMADGRGPGFRGRFVGRLHVSGAAIIHDGKKILHMTIGNEPVEEERWYRVASSDYLQRGSGYPSLAHNRNDRYLAEEIKDVIEIYAKRSDFVKRAARKRWVEKSRIKV